MLDWEGKLAAVVFLKGCNLRCPYCHNPELVSGTGGPHTDWDQVDFQLRAKRGWVDGVVITGGEPTTNINLPTLAAKFKRMGLPVKLDTNGTKPEIVAQLTKQKLIDYVAMDIKSSFARYDRAAGVVGYAPKVADCIDLVIDSGLPHEFRTTMVPGLVGEDDAIAIARYLRQRGAQRYFLQQFNPGATLSADCAELRPYAPDILERLASTCAKVLPTEMRGRRHAYS